MGVGHVSSPWSGFQVPPGVWAALGMAPSSPCHHPMVEKGRTKPGLSPWCRAGRAQLPSPGRCWRGKKCREILEECAGLSIPSGWRQNICTAHPALPQRASQADRHPNPAFSVPKTGQNPSTADSSSSPLIPLAVFSQIAKERRRPPARHGSPHSHCCWDTSVWGTPVSPEPGQPQPLAAHLI